MANAVPSNEPSPAGSGSQFGKSLRDGLTGGAAIFFLMLVWMFLRGPDTADKMQRLLPFKTASIQEEPAEPQKPVVPEHPSKPSEKTLPSGRVITPLTPVPVEGLTENVNGHALPVVRLQDDLTPFQAYKAPFTAVAGKNLVSLVVLDYGLSSKISQSMLDNLPAEISLVLSPYADDPAKWASAARGYGHEFWLGLPMQTKDNADAGPDALMTNSALEENQKRIQNVLGHAVGYAGVVTEKNHIVSSDDASAPTILKQIFGRGLAIAESNPEVAAFGLSHAMENGYPYAQNNFWIDEALDAASIDRALQAVEMQAGSKGKAIAFFHPYPVVVQRVQAWIEEAQKRGIQIAPLSAMAQ